MPTTEHCRDCGPRATAAVHDKRSNRYDHEHVCEHCGRSWRGHDPEGRCEQR